MRIRNSLSVALATVAVVSASQLGAIAININGVELTKPDHVSESVWKNVVRLLKDLIGKRRIRVDICMPKDPDRSGALHRSDTCYYAVMLNFDGKDNEFPENYGDNGNIALVPKEGFFAFRFRLNFLQEKSEKGTKNCQWLFEQYGGHNYVDLPDSRYGQLFRRNITGPLFERKSDHILEEETRIDLHNPATFDAFNETSSKICRMVIRQAVILKFFPLLYLRCKYERDCRKHSNEMESLCSLEKRAGGEYLLKIRERINEEKRNFKELINKFEEDCKGYQNTCQSYDYFNGSIEEYLDAIDYLIDNGKLFSYGVWGEAKQIGIEDHIEDHIEEYSDASENQE